MEQPRLGDAEQRRLGGRGTTANYRQNDGEIPCGRRNTVWTKYRLDLTRNNSRSASSTVRQVRQGRELPAGGAGSSHRIDRSLLQFCSDTMLKGRSGEEEDDREVREREKTKNDNMTARV